MKCKDCKWWDTRWDDSVMVSIAITINTTNKGICRRYAPKTMPRMETKDSFYTYWPITTKDDWCGESEAK